MKARRVKRIKSKKYHRILRREKERGVGGGYKSLNHLLHLYYEIMIMLFVMIVLFSHNRSFLMRAILKDCPKNNSKNKLNWRHDRELKLGEGGGAFLYLSSS